MIEFSFLTQNDVPQMQALQSIVLEDLKKKSQEHFIIERSEHYFTSNTRPPHAVLGLFDVDHHVIAQSIFHHTHSLNPDYMKGLSLDEYNVDDPISIFQGALIHPAHRGQKILPRMIDRWLEWVEEKKYAHALTRVEEHNEKSIIAFQKAGLTDIGSIIDARDNATVKVFYCKGVS